MPAVDLDRQPQDTVIMNDSATLRRHPFQSVKACISRGI